MTLTDIKEFIIINSFIKFKNRLNKTMSLEVEIIEILVEGDEQVRKAHKVIEKWK